MVCLVSPGHISSNPRLVKEADALANAGYDVHVIYGETYRGALKGDADILNHVEWSHQKVSLFNSSWRAFSCKLVFKLALTAIKLGWKSLELAKLASHPLYLMLRKAAFQTEADLYIGHCLPLLPIVVDIAQSKGKKCSFDAEDFHSAENNDTDLGKYQNLVAKILEAHYLPKCDAVTAASPLISKAYNERYKIESKSILNVFPRTNIQPNKIQVSGVPSFYWFSQTIGKGRGLEEFISILQLIGFPSRLDLRGVINDAYRTHLEGLIKGSSIELNIMLPDSPDRMVHCALGYTAGLALELTEPYNRDICLTNKAFTYILAGIPVIFSNTSAQEQLSKEFGNASLLMDLNDKAISVNRLKKWLSDPEGIRKASEQATSLGKERYNWSVEKEKFLEIVHQLVKGTSGN